MPRVKSLKSPTSPVLALDVHSLPPHLPAPNGYGEWSGTIIYSFGSGVIDFPKRPYISASASIHYRYIGINKHEPRLLWLRYDLQRLHNLELLSVLPVYEMPPAVIVNPVAIDSGENNVFLPLIGGPRFRCNCGSKVWRLFLSPDGKRFLCRRCIGWVDKAAVAQKWDVYNDEDETSLRA